MDVYSRYVFIQALRTKTGEEVFDKLKVEGQVIVLK